MLKKWGNAELEHKPGVAVAIIYKKRILLLRRRNIPFTSNPGIWSLLTGGLKKGEAPLNAAYREVLEETGINGNHLKLLSKPLKASITDAVRKKGRWYNTFYVFRSDTNVVKLDLENSAYRWAGIGELKEGDEYTNIFMNVKGIMKTLKSAIDE